MDSKIEILNNKLKKKDDEIKRLNVSINIQKNYLKNKDREIDRLKEEKKVLKNEIKKAKKRISELELKKSEISNSQNHNNSIIEKQFFPEGEQYCQLIRDNNIDIKKENNKVKAIQLFFTLNNVVKSHKKHSFGVAIKNNIKIDNTAFLGYLENKTGNIIEFGTIFQIYYFLEREQTIIVVPIIDKEETGKKSNFK